MVLVKSKKFENTMISSTEDPLSVRITKDSFIKTQMNMILLIIVGHKLRRLKIKGDCSLYVYNSQQEDQGEYVCTYSEPDFKIVPFQNHWIAGHVTCKVTLMRKDLEHDEVPTVTKEFRNNILQ